MTMPQTAIVVPCYNEAQRLKVDHFRRFAAASPSIRFFMVNDGSRDDTGGILAHLAASAPQSFAHYDLVRNQGKAEAVRQGMLQAFADGPDYVGFWDADLATPLEAIPAFCDVLNRHAEVNLVLGVRLPLLGRQIHRKPIRKVLGRLFSHTASWLLQFPMYDTQCGAKLFRATQATRDAFSSPFLSRWIFDVEILARLIRQGDHLAGRERFASIYELPLDVWQDVAGSKLKSGDFYVAAKELLAIYRSYPAVPVASTGRLPEPDSRDVPAADRRRAA